MSFVPMESQVYSLEKATAFQWHYNQQYQSNENRPKTKEEQEKAEKASLLTARYLWNFLSGMTSKHNLKEAA